MQWYLIKTWAGREEELVKKIRRTIPKQRFCECFVIYQERIWRKQQKSIVHVEPLFPGCVFLTGTFVRGQGEETQIKKMKIKETKIEETKLKETKLKETKLRGITKLKETGGIGNDDFHLLPIMQEDARFLEKISGKDHIVRLSYVQKDKEGNISWLSEPLHGCRGEIERMQFKKRYAMVRHRLWGEERILVLGILLNEDIHAQLLDERGRDGVMIDSVEGTMASTAREVLTEEMA